MTTAVAPFVREDLDTTLVGLREQLSETRDQTNVTEVPTSDIEIRLTANTPAIRLGQTEVPATDTGLQAFGDLLSVPGAFLRRVGGQDVELQQMLLNRLLQSAADSTVAVRYGEGGVNGVFEPGKVPMDPSRLITIGERVLGTGEAVVQRAVATPQEFSFDVHVPFDYDHGVGGDSEMVPVPEALTGYSWRSKVPLDEHARVRDITAGGLRFGVDLKRGLAPYVQPWLFRLACTNGMETTDQGLKVDARGSTVDEVLADLEAQAEIAFSRVEQQIEHFYRLRDQRVDNPERELISMARERNIPERSLRALLAMAPTEALPDQPTRFDIVNLVTNLANSPAVRNDGGRLLLERAGGGVVTDESIRCGHCHQRTTA